VRVGIHFLAVAVQEGENFVWFWIGHHSENNLGVPSEVIVANDSSTAPTPPDMNRFGIISVCVLSLLGCRHAPPSASGAALLVWRSPHSSLQQRSDAVNKLIVQGTRIEEVECVLGSGGVWMRFPEPPTFRFVYAFPDGGVGLEFESSMAFGARFWSASPVQTPIFDPGTDSF
jgi:hypothetical protein